MGGPAGYLWCVLGALFCLLLIPHTGIQSPTKALEPYHKPHKIRTVNTISHIYYHYLSSMLNSVIGVALDVAQFAHDYAPYLRFDQKVGLNRYIHSLIATVVKFDKVEIQYNGSNWM